MSLFEKKFCDVCGEKISLLGNRKLEDGNLCKDCAKKLSPFFSERKQSTVEEIKQQLAYREENKQNLSSFNATRTLGNTTKVIIDDNQRKFIVTTLSDFRSGNPDIIDLSCVSSVRYDVDESKTERYTKDAEGNRKSFNPPQYDYHYTIKVSIYVNHPYFSEIHFDVNNASLDSRYNESFRKYEHMANEIVAALSGAGTAAFGAAGVGYQQMNNGYQQPIQQGYQQMNNAYQQPSQQGYQQPVQQVYQQMNNAYQQPVQQDYQQPAQQAAADSESWYCPNCGAPNNSNFCQNCGTQKPN